MPKEEKKSFLTRIVERKPPLYWWVLLNISIGCLAVMSWLYFVPTFNYPEVPEHYERMIKLGRAPELPSYKAPLAPKGTTISPEKAHQIFTSSELTEDDLAELNKTLLRNYIQNIKITKLNYYIKGTFKVSETRKLNKNDLFADGIAIKATAQRQVGTNNRLVPFLVEIEYLLPGLKASDMRHFTKGKMFEIYEVPNYCNVLHAARSTGADGETIVRLTVVPIVTDPPLIIDENTTLHIKTPERIYPANELPIFKKKYVKK